MEEKKSVYPWGSRFYSKVSKDLENALPKVKSFSQRNLQYMNQFYRMFPDALNAKQVSPRIEADEITHQVDAQKTKNEITHQVDAQIGDKIVFFIPWGHIKVILDKCRDNKDKALFYVRKTLDNYWSRAVLLNFLDTDLYERQGKAVTNFNLTLPEDQSDLAQAITKDPYNFDFLTIREKYDEKELKDALMDNVGKFLLELGNGFAFVGREVRLEIGETEEFVDMLFYNIKLHCYVVVEVKVEEFNARDMGQLGTYMVTVNHQLKGENDGPTLGLIICKSKDNVKAQYALEASSQPMGISAYDINTFLPEDYKSSLPTIEEIEAELS
jgi:predicted nuclease of restriction endonuclease-like (RecB) superfamily